MSEEAIGMVAVVILFAVLPAMILAYMHKVKIKKMDTLIKLVELGGNVDPDMMKMLSEGGGTYKTDYKWGLIWLAIGIPVVLGLLTTGGADAAMFASVPAWIGVAYLISGKLRLREPDKA